MKKKILVCILSLLCAFVTAASFTACDFSFGGTESGTESGKVTDTGGEKNNSPADNNLPLNISDLNVNGSVDELLSVEELVDFHLNGDKYPKNFVLEELNDCDYVLYSTSSKEEVLALAEKQFARDGETVVENRLIAETNLLYGIYLKYSHYSIASEKTIYYDHCLISFKKEVYDSENKRFITKDKDEIKTVLDYLYHCRSYRTGGTKVYSSDIAVEGDVCKYTAYLLMVSFGDWGLQDQLYLVKTECLIDVITGELNFNYKEVGSVFIDGELTHIGGVESYD